MNARRTLGRVPVLRVDAPPGPCIRILKRGGCVNFEDSRQRRGGGDQESYPSGNIVSYLVAFTTSK